MGSWSTRTPPSGRGVREVHRLPDVTTDTFPTVVKVPVGMPGEESIYAQPKPPELFAR
jgi:hypothetical protein